MDQSSADVEMVGPTSDLPQESPTSRDVSRNKWLLVAAHKSSGNQDLAKGSGPMQSYGVLSLFNTALLRG